MSDDTGSNKQRVLGYTDELGNMLKHVKNHMPNTRLTEEYPRAADDDVSFDTSSPFPIKAPFSIRFVQKDVDKKDAEGNPVTDDDGNAVKESKTFICVCNNAVPFASHEGDTDAYPSYFRIPRLLHTVDGADTETDIYQLPITYSEKPIDEIMKEFPTSSAVIFSVCIFVHFIKKKVYLKLRTGVTVPSPEEYMLGVAGLDDENGAGFLSNSFVCFEVGRIRINKITNGDGTFSYKGTILENMSRRTIFGGGDQSYYYGYNLIGAAFSITSHFLLGRYLVVCDIDETDDTLKFNTGRFIYNKKIVIRPGFRNSKIEIYVNGTALFEVPSVELSIPEDEHPPVVIKFIPPNDEDTNISCGAMSFDFGTLKGFQLTQNTICVMSFFISPTGHFSILHLNTEITDVLYKEVWDFSCKGQV